MASPGCLRSARRSRAEASSSLSCGAVVHGVAEDHLRRHVEELALEGAGLGAGADGLGAGDAEVDDLHRAIDAHVDVVGREVTVDDAQGAAVLVLGWWI